MKKYIIPVLIMVALSACNYMDEKPYDWAQPIDVFSMEASYEKPITQAYSYLKGGFNRISGSFLDAATDDGMSTINISTIHRLSRAYTTSNNPVENCWDASYQGIRQALFVQKNLAEIDLVLNNKSSEDVIEIKNIYSGEMYCLRALYEFDLLRHYGGYPIVSKFYNLGDPELSQKQRSSFADCVNNIISLCDSAEKYLDVTPVGGNGGFGRMTKGAALAIKAKTLILAASPLFNQSGNGNTFIGYTNASASDIQARWESAAAACAAVINLKKADGANAYSLHANYERLFVTSPNNEYIIFVSAPKSNGLENRQLPPTLSRDLGGGTVPTQEFVDAFTMADGSDYVESDISTQYKNRDPRLVASIGFNGSTYGALGTIQTKLGDGSTIDGLNLIADRSTNTGYYLRKFIDFNIDFSKASPGTAFHLFPLIRLADVFLLYAEAMNEAYGPDVDPLGFGLSAKAAVQRVRTRAGFKANDKYLTNVADVATMRSKIKDERRVELSFEEQRYFDLRRWMDGNKLNQSVTGIRIEQVGANLTANYFTVDGLRRFESKCICIRYHCKKQ
ncbi:RagB/SusD family nutrient uptake outer membrane protein [Niabella ginsengisoli]|uniref:RagB/SusD family nutrient uptake outer membrane protein n=1 Tax=Niabella ginsengisoli TaxID=522298 RepID=A0ABS9SKR0_9BACT|nr:RagB/SusD family nutrient uptake outer membrane protein [Niabella ginsengisoli]MCH5598973.1 RagB/SusD family nutrient uptake outer membrane protein [Niabella ginsengisoli]